MQRRTFTTDCSPAANSSRPARPPPQHGSVASGCPDAPPIGYARCRPRPTSWLSRERTLLGEIRRLEIDRQIKKEELAAIDGDLAETTGQLEDTATRMADLEREADAQRPRVEARLVALYKMGVPRYTRLLLGAGDLRTIGRNYRLLGSLARRDREQFEDLRQTVADLQASRSTLGARQVEVAALQDTARAARRALDRAIASQTALVE